MSYALSTVTNFSHADANSNELIEKRYESQMVRALVVSIRFACALVSLSCLFGVVQWRHYYRLATLRWHCIESGGVYIVVHTGLHYILVFFGANGRKRSKDLHRPSD